MSPISKFVFTALVALGGVAANANEAAPRSVVQVLPVVSAHAGTPSLSAVRYVAHRHHHRHRAHPVRHVR